MPAITPQDLQDELATIARVWTANPDFKLKEMSLEQFTARVAGWNDLLGQIKTREDELLMLRNTRSAQTDELWNIAVRARAGIKGYFGDDSNQYELAGGTRVSERKRRAATKATESTGTPKAA